MCVMFYNDCSCSFIISLKDRQTDFLIDWQTDRLTDSLTDWLTDWLKDRQTDWLTHWLTDWLTDWYTDWLTDWRISYYRWFKLFLLMKSNEVRPSSPPFYKLNSSIFTYYYLVGFYTDLEYITHCYISSLPSLWFSIWNFLS